MGGMFGPLAILVGAVLYFLPALLIKGYRNAGSVFILNLLLGWTGVAWIIALVWAMKERGGPKLSEMRPCPACRQLIHNAAWKCPHCGTSS